MYILSPKEIYVLKKRKFAKAEIKKYEARINGFGLFNGKIYLLNELPEVLKRSNVSLKIDGFKNVNEIKGVTASGGAPLSGKVKLILNKKHIKILKRMKY